MSFNQEKLTGYINYEAILNNIYDGATDDEKKFITEVLSLKNANLSINNMTWQRVDKLIKKYRPEFLKAD